MLKCSIKILKKYLILWYLFDQVKAGVSDVSHPVISSQFTCLFFSLRNLREISEPKLIPQRNVRTLLSYESVTCEQNSPKVTYEQKKKTI